MHASCVALDMGQFELITRLMQCPYDEALIEDSLFVWFLVSSLNDWHYSGVVARCSRQHLRFFTSPDILPLIVKDLKRRRAPLLRWLCFETAGSMLWSNDGAWLPPHCPLHTSDMETIHSLVKDPLITGGTVCQALYHREWVCDLDVFYRDDRRHSCRAGYMSLPQRLDLIKVTDVDATWKLSTFDLSVVQQGFYRSEFWRTPLSLYTQMTRDVIVAPDVGSVSYNDNDTRHRFSCNPWEYIDAHDAYCSTRLFHLCKCETLASSQTMDKWKERVTRYARRFPDFTFSYIRPWRGGA